jgi:hypothetical protein
MSLADLIPDLDRRLAERIEASVRGFESAVLDHLREQHERTRETLAALRPVLGSTLAAEDLEPLRVSAASGAREQAHAALLAAARAVDGAEDQVEVLCRLLEQSAPLCGRAAVLIVEASGARGWAGRGFGDGIRALDGVVLTWHDPAWGPFAAGSGVVQLGDAGHSLCTQVGGEAATAAWAIPLVLQGRVAAALYVDGSPTGVDLAPLQLLAQLASARIESLGSRGASPTLRHADGGAGLPLGLTSPSSEPTAAVAAGAGLAVAAAMPTEEPEPTAAPLAEAEVAAPAIAEPTLDEPASSGPEPLAAAAFAEPEAPIEPEAVAEVWAPESDAVEAVETSVEVVEADAMADHQPAEELFAAALEPEPAPVAAPEDAPSAEDLWSPVAVESTAPAVEAADLEPAGLEPIALEPTAFESSFEAESVEVVAEAAHVEEVFEAEVEAEPETAEAPADSEVEEDIFAAEPVEEPAAPFAEAEELSAELPELPPLAVTPAEPVVEVAPAPFESVDATVAVSQSLLKQYAASQGAAAVTGQVEVPPPAPPAPVESPVADAEDETVLLRRPTAPAVGPDDETNPTIAKPGTEVKSQGGMVVPPSDLAGPGWAFRAGRTAEATADPALEEARRLARLLVSEIKLYNEEQVEEGRRKRDLYARLRDDIDRSREVYESRVNPKALEHDFFREALVRVLAGGDPNVLGA